MRRGTIRFTALTGIEKPTPEFVPVLVEKLGDEAQSIVIGRPSLEDVFITKTGQEFTT